MSPFSVRYSMHLSLRPLAVVLIAAFTAAVLPACQPSSAPRADSLDAIAAEYVAIVLAAGNHDSDFVDAYHGPAEAQARAEEDRRSLAELIDAANALRARLAALTPGEDALEQLRHRYLDRQLLAAATRLRLVSGEKIAFDEQVRLLYDTVVPTRDASHYDAVLARIDALIPGTEPLPERVSRFRDTFAIPPERLDAVFSAAIAACRERTLAHIGLPKAERFTIEYVSEKPWSGYNWYKGDFYSLIQVNTDLPMYIDRAVDLGCHEGYPGHHTYNVLLEEQLADGLGWTEFTVYALFSPQSLIAEGSANYGIEMAFPGEDRLAFERDVLMPLAGMQANAAERYWLLGQELLALKFAEIDAARSYLDGIASRDETEQWLRRYMLVTPERAAKRVDFFDTYGAYVINYSHGRKLVADWVEAQAGPGGDRWKVFAGLLGSPRLPGSLE